MIDIEETAKRLAVSTKTIRRWVEEGKFPAYKFGKQYRFKVTEVDAYIEASRVKPGERIDDETEAQ